MPYHSPPRDRLPQEERFYAALRDGDWPRPDRAWRLDDVGLNAAGLSAAYRPLRHVTLQLLLRRETRSTDFALAEYAANIASLVVRLGL